MKVAKDYKAIHKELGMLMGKLGKEIPGTLGAFSKLHESVFADGVLDAKTKELISLGISICIRCEGCIVSHVHDALKAGATREEIMETISVSILMGGGPSVAYGCEAYAALEQFTEE